MQLYYQLWPSEWDAELNDNAALKKATDPTNQQRRGLDGTKDFLRLTRFGKELGAFFSAERASLKDGKGTVTFRTNPVEWLKACTTYARVVKLGLVVQAAPGSEIGVERIWKVRLPFSRWGTDTSSKDLDEVVTKKRAKISVERSFDQVFLDKFWRVSETEPELASVRPILVKAKRAGAPPAK